MIDLQTEINTLQSTINLADPDTRYRHEPELRHMIDHLHARGMAVPTRVKQLHQTLLSEAIEAEFDNMPV